MKVDVLTASVVILVLGVLVSGFNSGDAYASDRVVPTALQQGTINH